LKIINRPQLSVFVLRLMKTRRLVVCLIIGAVLIPFALLCLAASAGAQSSHSAAEHMVMGNPSGATTDVNNPGNYLMEKTQYVLSYNRDKGTPNWVSWHLDSSWITGVADRQDDYRPDTSLPSGWYQVKDTDYDFANTGFQRGHMCPSADRTSSVADNSATFLMTNFIPQSPDNNQGPWEKLEAYLRTLVGQGNEVYIISGPNGVGGQGSVSSTTTNTIANGHVTVPQKTWKVALVLPVGDNDVSRVGASTRTIAVIMPNVQGIRSDSWQKYLATVDQVESLTGYNFFSNVPQNIQDAVESKLDAANNTAPVASPQTISTTQNTPVGFTLTATDANVNNQLAYSIVGSPAHGVLSGTAPNLVYTPATNFSGTDTFTFKANDSTADSNTATVTINISSATTPTPTPTPTPAVIATTVVGLTSNTFIVNENDASGVAIITVSRSGDTTTAVSVDYTTSDQSGTIPCQSTSNGIASERCDYATAAGTLRFAAGEQAKTIQIPIINDAYVETSEAFVISLRNPQGAVFGAIINASVTINSDDFQTATQNPIDDQAFFIRQQYIDFLGRPPEDAGFQFWMNRMNNCPPGQVCDRIDTSQRFFQSDEFQARGFYVYRLYDAVLGRLPHYTEFVADVARLNGFQTVAEQRASKDAYLLDFINRTEFRNLYGQYLSADGLTATDAAGFVNALTAKSGITPASKQTLINNLQNGTRDPAHTLEDFILTPELSNVGTLYYDRGFITMQYFGYLRRDPEQAGFDFWVSQLIGPNAPHRQDYRFMVGGFLQSDEHRFRFAMISGGP
jgi:endonuclease G